jgi:CMP-N,N'-diacetyllegionaminic acid synthase
MIDGKLIIALIPARGGSKGLPGKNTRPLLGKPLIAWTIEQAKACKFIDRIVVTTDDRDIAKTSEQYNAEVPFLRPAELATDQASTIDTVLHALSFFEKEGNFYDSLILLEPTSPLRDVSDIENGLRELYSNNEAESIVGVSKVVSAHPSFLLKTKNGFIRSYLDTEFPSMRRQEITDFFFPEGSFYAAYCRSLIERKSFYHKQTLAYILPKYKAYEIDELDDFIIVEALLKAKNQGIFH